MAVFFATLGAKDDAELVAILLQLGLRNFLIPRVDISGTKDFAQPLGKSRVLEHRADSLSEAQNLVGVDFYS